MKIESNDSEMFVCAAMVVMIALIIACSYGCKQCYNPTKVTTAVTNTQSN